MRVTARHRHPVATPLAGFADARERAA